MKSILKNLAFIILISLSTACSNVKHSTKKAVTTASNSWIHNFNQQNLDYISDAYSENAFMEAKPFGTYETKEEIRAFWKDLIYEKNATSLVYSNTKIEIINDSTALISADWKMNIGEGIITQEKWVKEKDGVWRLLADHFEVIKQY